MACRRTQIAAALLAAVVLIVLGGWGCAYFNAFYNARKQFREAEKENRQVIESQSGRPQTQKYNNAIDSAAKLLQNYPNSKWADDALLLMGKAYYRIQQYNGAERKFQELFSNYPDSPLIPEGKYWWALTLKRTGKSTEAISQLRALSGTELPRELMTRVQFSLADILFDDKFYDKARVEYEKIVEKAQDDDDRANAQFRVAQCFAEEDKDSLAAQAFAAVLPFHPRRSLEFEAQFNYATAQKELERYDEVREIFEKLLSKEVYFDYFPRVELELADLLARTGQVEEAKTKYQRLIEVNPRTEISARACYELGMIALNHDRDLNQAGENFRKVRGESSTSKYVPLAQAEITALENYARISDARQQVASQIVALEDALNSLRSGSEPADSTQETPTDRDADSVQIKSRVKSLYLDLDAHDYRLAEYYRYDLNDIDSTISILRFLVRPGVSDTVRAKALISMGEIYRDSLDSPTVSDSFYQVLITDYAGTDFEKIGQQALGLPQTHTHRDSVKTEYDLADSLLWVVGDTLRALDLFKELAQGDTSLSTTLYAQYTVGWIYENIYDNKDSARVAYRQLTERFATSDLGQEVKKRIEAVAEEPTASDSAVPVTDSTMIGPERPTPEQTASETEGAPEELETTRRILKR